MRPVKDFSLGLPESSGILAGPEPERVGNEELGVSLAVCLNAKVVHPPHL